VAPLVLKMPLAMERPKLPAPIIAIFIPYSLFASFPKPREFNDWLIYFLVGFNNVHQPYWDRNIKIRLLLIAALQFP